MGAVRSRRARGRSIATPRAFASTRGTGRAGSGARRGGRAFPAPPRGAFRTTIDERAARTGGAAAGACAPRLERSSPITMCVRSWAGRSMRAIRCSRASKCVSADEGNNTRGKLSSSGRREAWTNELGRRPAAESQHSGRPAVPSRRLSETFRRIFSYTNTSGTRLGCGLSLSSLASLTRLSTAFSTSSRWRGWRRPSRTPCPFPRGRSAGRRRTAPSCRFRGCASASSRGARARSSGASRSEWA